VPSLGQLNFIVSIIARRVFSLNTHRYHSLVASSEITALKDRSRVLIYVWNPSKLETLAELRREQFGSDISLLNFGPKSDDNLLLVVSRERPKVLLIIDWKRNEFISSVNVSVIRKRAKERFFMTIQCKSDRIISALFLFNTTSWIACLNEQHLLFYQINWNCKPLKITLQREGDVQVRHFSLSRGSSLISVECLYRCDDL
jgi:hypothetical protein